MNKKILVLDIDGTLTNSKKEITDATREAIIKVQQEGHIVVIASGRPTPGTYEVAKKIKLDEYGGYLLSYNGARISRFDTGESVYEKPLPHEVLAPIAEFTAQHKLGMITYDDEQVLVCHELDEYIEFEARICKLTTKKIEDVANYVDFPVYKCLLTGKPEHAGECVTKLQEMYGDTLSIYRSEAFFIEVMAPGIDKAQSLARLLDILKMDVKDMICCGDGYNDRSMIAFAGVGVAMENAVDEVKEVADYITLSNDEDGLIPVIEKYIYS